MAMTTKNDVPAADAGLPNTLRQVQIEARCATVRRAAEDNYRRVAVSAVANEPRDGVSVAAGLVEAWVQATVADHFYDPIAAVCDLNRLLGDESRAKIDAKVRAELAYLRQRLDRLEERLPARMEAAVLAGGAFPGCWIRPMRAWADADPDALSDLLLRVVCCCRDDIHAQRRSTVME